MWIKSTRRRSSRFRKSSPETSTAIYAWAREAREFESPILIEWGTEPNGNWFGWNGKWNGGAKEGPARYVAAYRHIVDLMRAEGADNLQWVWHVNWYDEPETKWNAFENYFPGNAYCDWVALSAYGPTTPTAHDGTESLRFKMAEAYPRLTKLAPGKPIVIAEFGCDLHNPPRGCRGLGGICAGRFVLRSMAGHHRLLLVERRLAERRSQETRFRSDHFARCRSHARFPRRVRAARG